MFNTLPQFYNSTLWRDFRMQIILERTHDDGFVYCEHSGKPLTETYDIVAHHIKPLTIDNVNDYSVSLNPENIMLVSQKAHNEIHGRFGYVAERKVYFVYGSPCSGKTTFVNEIKGNSDLIIDIDNIWEALTGKRYEKPNAIKSIVFAIRESLYDMVRIRSGKWERAYVIEGAARKHDRERKIALLGAEPIFINTDKETCLQRLASDSKRTLDQKQEWEKYIDEWFEDFTE